MNAETGSAVAILVFGLLMALFSKQLCRKTRNVPQMRMLGVCLAIAGAILLFLP